jgi:hypothetical protein
MITGQVTVVTEHTAGSELAATATNAGTLTVVDIDEYVLDGGQVTLGTVTTTYTVPEDTSTLVLGTTVAGTFAVGESVTLYPETKERMAHIIEPGAEEVLEARVPHALFDRLAVGSRGTAEAEVVEAAMMGTDFVITDVLGRESIHEHLNIAADEHELDAEVYGTDISKNLIKWLRDDKTVVADLIVQGQTSGSTLAKLLLSLYQSASSSDELVLRVVDSSGTGTSSLTLARSSVGVGAYPKALTLLNAGGASDWLLADGSNFAWSNWTPTLSGWSADPTNAVYRYAQIGKLVIVSIRQATAGTSNATTKSLSAPVQAATVTNMIWAETCSATDNGTDLTTSSQVSIASGSSTINFAKDLSTITGGWTNTGSCKIKYCTLIYEAA